MMGCAPLMPQQAPNDPNANVPVKLVRRYEVLVRPQAKHKPLKLREVSADHIGRLVTLQAGFGTLDLQTLHRVLFGYCLDL